MALVIFEGQRKESWDEFEEPEKDVGQTEVTEQGRDVCLCSTDGFSTMRIADRGMRDSDYIMSLTIKGMVNTSG